MENAGHKERENSNCNFMQHAAAKWFSQQIMRPTAVVAMEHATWISHACPQWMNVWVYICTYIQICVSIAQKRLPRFEPAAEREETKFAFLIKSWDRSKPSYQGQCFGQRGTETAGVFRFYNSSHYGMRISSQRMTEVVAAKRISPNADGFMNSLTCFLLI